MIRLAAAVAFVMLRLLEMTVRPKLVGWDRAQALLDRGEPVAFALRHGDGLLLLLGRSVLPRGTVLVSQSVDGEFATHLIGHFGQAVVRGSTSRGGVAGLRALLRRLTSTSPPFLPVDGPRGPTGVPGPGSAALARLGGAWIVPLSAACTPSGRLRTWDRTTVPLPFARSLVLVGRPIPPEPGGDQLLDCLARRLAAGGQRAARLCGVRP